MTTTDSGDAKRSDALDRIQAHEKDLTWKFQDGSVYVRLGLILTVYFPMGYSPDGRERIIECIEYFANRYGEHLRGKQFSDRSGGGGKYTALRKGAIEKLADKARALGENYALCWQMSSEATQELAPEYEVSVLTSQGLTEREHGKRSYFKIALPWIVLKTEGVQSFLRLVSFVCNKLRVEHGYAGLAPMLPYGETRYLMFEKATAERFSGLVVDALAHLDLRTLGSHSIKGVNWLTIVGDDLLAKLGGRDQVKSRLKQPGMSVHGYDNGLIVQAGDAPSLGAPEDGLPPLYVAANSVFRPIRIKDPDQLHYHCPGRDVFDKESSAAWYARFDVEEPVLPEEVIKCEPGEPVPREGWWFTYGLPIGSHRRYFKVGDHFPPETHVPPIAFGITWYWRAGDQGPNRT